MAQGKAGSYTHAHRFLDDGSVSFVCSSDRERWPWLALDARDPIVVQSLNFFAIYETAVVRGEYAPGQWTALTHTDWQCGPREAGHAVRGISRAPDPVDEGAYHVDLYDAADTLCCRLRGRGVVFRNRDFDAWRAQSKTELGEPMPAGDFAYAEPRRLGMASPVQCLVGDLQGGANPTVRALVTPANGFPPAHPFHDGSGDHVNAAHLADAGRQLLRLVSGNPRLAVPAGEMVFSAYVELGHPFELELPAGSHAGRVANGVSEMTVRQGGRVCATLRLQGSA